MTSFGLSVQKTVGKMVAVWGMFAPSEGQLSLSFHHQLPSGNSSPHSPALVFGTFYYVSFHMKGCRSLGNICNQLFSQPSHNIPKALPISHLSSFSPIFHQVAADFQVFRFVQQLTACGCQSWCPQGRDGGGCQQSGDLQGTPLFAPLYQHRWGSPKGVPFCSLQF